MGDASAQVFEHIFSAPDATSFAQLLVKNWPGHVRSPSYHVIKGTSSGHCCDKWRIIVDEKAISTKTKLLLTNLGQN